MFAGRARRAHRRAHRAPHSHTSQATELFMPAGTLSYMRDFSFGTADCRQLRATVTLHMYMIFTVYRTGQIVRIVLKIYYVLNTADFLIHNMYHN